MLNASTEEKNHITHKQSDPKPEQQWADQNKLSVSKNCVYFRLICVCVCLCLCVLIAFYVWIYGENQADNSPSTQECVRTPKNINFFSFMLFTVFANFACFSPLLFISSSHSRSRFFFPLSVNRVMKNKLNFKDFGNCFRLFFRRIRRWWWWLRTINWKRLVIQVIWELWMFPCFFSVSPGEI